MSKMKRGWLVVAAALAVGASGIARADDSGGGGDAGDNGMNPMYGDSYANLEGQGRNAGTPRMAPEGAFAAHEMDGQTTTPLIDRMRQTQATMTETARHNWNAMVEKTHAMTDRMRTSMNTQSSTTGSATATPTATSNLTGSTSAPSAAGPVMATPADTTSAPSASATTAPAAAGSGVRIAPVNPKGQAPTIVAPSGG